MKIPFTKMSGAGNDFVVVEARPGLRGPDMARRLCPRRTSIGADGLLLLERPRGKTPPRMIYFNADGSRAFCANGARCAAVWMQSRGWTKKSFSFLSDEGPLEARIEGPGRARLRMPTAGAGRWLEVRIQGRLYKGWFINTGVPHFVLPVQNLDRVEVETLGRALRRHPAFGKPGTNVNFVQWGRPLRLRSYERGVEAETLACGTGAVAAALCALSLKKSKSPVTLLTQGGDRLKVSVKPDGEIWLDGPAQSSFEGSVSL